MTSSILALKRPRSILILVSSEIPADLSQACSLKAIEVDIALEAASAVWQAAILCCLVKVEALVCILRTSVLVVPGAA